MDVGPGGLDLTPFARQIYKHPDVEVHFVQINIKLAQRQLPLRLAAAGFPRTPIEDGTCPRILEMQVVAVPPEMRRSTFVLPSGQVLFPFEDSPHITNDGVLLHGRSALQRAIVYRLQLDHSGCPFHGQAALCAPAADNTQPSLPQILCGHSGHAQPGRRLEGHLCL